MVCFFRKIILEKKLKKISVHFFVFGVCKYVPTYIVIQYTYFDYSIYGRKLLCIDIHCIQNVFLSENFPLCLFFNFHRNLIFPLKFSKRNFLIRSKYSTFNFRWRFCLFLFWETHWISLKEDSLESYLQFENFRAEFANWNFFEIYIRTRYYFFLNDLVKCPLIKETNVNCCSLHSCV